ncbi:hypothetical protein L6R52_43490, partial [Myxococcota bacterium]|nr:hypothetical protein [Myxococcota bacterium]
MQGRSARLALVDVALFVGLSFFTLYAIFSVPFIATHDGPNHLASCVLANRLELPGSPLARWIEPGGALTTQGYQYICRPLEA